MCVCECYISDKIMNSSLISRRENYLKNKYQSWNAQKRWYVEMANCVFETHKNPVMPHGKHILNTASDMAMTTMCTYPS